MTQSPNKKLAHKLRPKIDRPIVFVGLMGCGKSSLGKALAPLLGLDFFDADTEIEDAAGMSVSEIFEKYGEPEFRSLERRRALRRRAENHRCRWWGLCQEDTRAVIKAGAVSVWLKAKLDVLVSRTQKRSHRPILAGKNHRDVLKRLLEERRPAYEQADLHLFSGPESIDKTLRVTLNKLHEYLQA